MNQKTSITSRIHYAATKTPSKSHVLEILRMSTQKAIQGIDIVKYADILQRFLISELASNFPNEDGIFQQDLASCHT